MLQSLKARPDLVILELGANDMLRGQPPADCDKADSDPLPAMPEPRLVSLGTLPDPSALLAQRPDVKAATVRAQAAASRAHVAWAARWPRSSPATSSSG